jgi:hypothetical protein
LIFVEIEVYIRIAKRAAGYGGRGIVSRVGRFLSKLRSIKEWGKKRLDMVEKG